jgi:hypothetical protein
MSARSLAAPLIFTSGTALTMMSLMGIMVVFSLSYNMLLGGEPGQDLRDGPGALRPDRRAGAGLREGAGRRDASPAARR